MSQPQPSPGEGKDIPQCEKCGSSSRMAFHQDGGWVCHATHATPPGQLDGETPGAGEIKTKQMGEVAIASDGVRSCIGTTEEFARRGVEDMQSYAPAVVTEGEMPLWSKLRNDIDSVIRNQTSDSYDCGRVWSAWSVGTMSEDDFTPFDHGDRVENFVYDLEAVYEPVIVDLRKQLAAANAERDKLERETRAQAGRIAELEGKVDRQRQRIVYLEGATSHACGTPLTIAKREADILRVANNTLEAERDRMRGALEDERRILKGLTGSADSLRSVIDAHEIRVESCNRTDDDDCLDRALEALKYWLEITKPHLRAALASAPDREEGA